MRFFPVWGMLFVFGNMFAHVPSPCMRGEKFLARLPVVNLHEEANGGLPFVEEMTLQEKVGQVLLVHFHGEEVNDDARMLVQELYVGGIIYYEWSNGLHSPLQVRDLSAGLQQLSDKNRLAIPLLIAVDQEGGVVSRLKKGFTNFPGNRAVAEAGDLDLAKRVAFSMGEELRSVGITMNLAPVVDVSSNLRNPIIGLRSFGQTPEQVTCFARQFVEGFTQANVIATLKHFPGHGDTSVDSHADMPIVLKSKEELAKVELFPFAKLASSVPAIMTAHILVPALDKDVCSTLSKKTLHYLREELGFKGVIVADSLVMQGVLKQCGSAQEAAIQALKAGCDLLILGGKLLEGSCKGFELTAEGIRRVHHAVVTAVESGRISEERLNDAVARVLTMKEKYMASPRVDEVAFVEHRALADEVAAKAAAIVEKDLSRWGDVMSKKVVVIAPEALPEIQFDPIGVSTEFCVYPSEGLLRKVEEADALVVFSYNAWKNQEVEELIRSLIATGKPAALICAGDPIDGAIFSDADIRITTGSPMEVSLEAAWALLKEALVCYTHPEN